MQDRTARAVLAVSTWLALISVDDIEAYAGTVPGRTMAEILAKIPKPA